MTTHPSEIEEILKDPEGRELVQAIHKRKDLAELLERIENSLMRHRVIRDGIAKPSGWCENCGNLDDGDQERHQAEVLVGLRQEAIAAAWDQGFASGKSRAMRHMSDEPKLPLTEPNPYREAAK